MKKTFSFRRSAPLIIVAMLVLSIIMLTLIYVSQSNRALESRPLVLIHSPLNHDPFLAGQWVSIYATARSDKGLRSVELWVNDTFVDLKNAPGDGEANSLTFSSSWLANTAGSNVVIVRAIDTDGTAGQASIMIEVNEPEGEVAGIVTLRQGDTFRSIADEYGLDPDLLQLANPGLDPDDLGPGDEIFIPDPEDPPADDPPADDPPADDPPVGDPPPPEGDPPGSGSPGLGLVDDLIVRPFGDLLQPLRESIVDLLGTEQAEDQVRLQLEMLGYTLGSTAGIIPEEIILYFSYGSYEDPALSETVRIPLHNLGLLEPLQIIDWPRARDLPISFTLVMVTDGGSNAFDINFDEEIPPEYWDGRRLIASAASEDGLYSFEITYSITQLLDSLFHTYIDRTITPPENVRIDFRRQSLRWDYNPRPDEEPIEGFRIYLNGSLQWVEPANARESRLPIEWLNPPCNNTHDISVTAYRSGIPRGPESWHGYETVFPDTENCQIEIMITFVELQTFDLGPDNRNPPYFGDVGPVYGEFFANEEKLTFDTNPARGWRGGSLDVPDGLRHNTRYNLGELVHDGAWNFNNSSPHHFEETYSDGSLLTFSSYHSLRVQIPEGGTFQFGFRIIDEDYGKDDDLLAEAESEIYNIRIEDLIGLNLWPMGEGDGDGDDTSFMPTEGVLVADNGRCQLRYVISFYIGGMVFIIGEPV